jgi:hypothetical protein
MQTTSKDIGSRTYKSPRSPVKRPGAVSRRGAQSVNINAMKPVETLAV